MTTTTLRPHPVAVHPSRTVARGNLATRPTTGADRTPPGVVDAPSAAPSLAPDRGRVLAFVAPLVLFVHGILVWVLGLGSASPSAVSGAGPLGADGDSSGTVSLAVGATIDGADVERLAPAVSGLTLVLAAAAFCWLVAALGTRLEHLRVGAPATALAAFGVGATAAVWLGQASGLLGATLPAALVVGGPVLVALGVAAVLAALTLEGRLPIGSAALAGVGALAVALPWGLLPLGALLLLIALAPLTRPSPDVA
ncbi:hypothetical protein [Intrasporangium sp. YIM S08009]|uniref:hypothetical protein n=1 Tax=Intrasporangium zincisolvens TaxID=3080018 RepID=UPI002B05267D|nr:hypothetical protein [Intrasporangium sp. YIM S08009]